MELNYRFKGKGIDASKIRFLKGDAIWFYKLPDNMYRIQHVLEPGTYDYVFSKDLIFATKYYWILLKEWFYMLKKGGKIIIEFEPEEKFTLGFLKKQILFLFGKRASVISSKVKGKTTRLIVEKEDYFEYEKHPIDEWTFGMITNGKNDDNVDKIIANIKSLGIPKYEIIICGIYNGSFLSDKLVRYINFTEKDHLGWITKKKNLIAEKAKYENLVVVHDRIFFENDWYDGIKSWGKCFEMIGCNLRKRGDEMEVSWGTTIYGVDDPRRSYCYELAFSDWDKYVFVGGAITVIKKSVWKEYNWDENRFWGHDEDIDLSHSLTERGYLTRYNPSAVCYSNRGTTESYVKLRLVKRIKRRGEIKGPIYNRIRTGGYSIYRKIIYQLYKLKGKKFRKGYSMEGYEKEVSKTWRVK